jgi:hypothetical protein
MQTTFIVNIIPLILAIWPTKLPTAPAAPLTTTTSLGLGLQTSRNPKYAELLHNKEQNMDDR